MGYSFTKLFSTITDSSIWSEDSDTKVVWVTMLAMADRKGRVMASIPGLAKRAGVSLPNTERALAKFLSPDPYSRTTILEGRRIEQIDGGWALINYQHYRDLRDNDAERERKRKWWNKNKGQKLDALDATRPGLTGIDTNSTQAEAEAEAEKYNTPPSPLAGELPLAVADRFDEFWALYPKRLAKEEARKAWCKVKPSDVEAIFKAVSERTERDPQWKKDGGQFVPHAATFLNKRRWEDQWEANAPLRRDPKVDPDWTPSTEWPQ